MIPKIIHYCWFGGNELPEEYASYIQGWKDLHPDWEIMRWDETNSPIDLPYLQKAKENKQWANMSNLVRLIALQNYGGIYLDTDVYVLKSLTPLLSNHCFFGFEEGSENSDVFWINNAVAGSEKKHEFINVLLDRLLIEFDGSEIPNESSPRLTTRLLKEVKGLKKYGFQQLDDIVLYPIEAFYPIGYEEVYKIKRLNLNDYPNSYTIHTWGRTWFTREIMLKMIDDRQELIDNQKSIIDETLLELKNTENVLRTANEKNLFLSDLNLHNEKTMTMLQQLQNDILGKQNEISDTHKLIDKTQDIIKEGFEQTSNRLTVISDLQKKLQIQNELISKHTETINSLNKHLEEKNFSIKKMEELNENRYFETKKKINAQTDLIEKSLEVQIESNKIFNSEKEKKLNESEFLKLSINEINSRIQALGSTLEENNKKNQSLLVEKKNIEKAHDLLTIKLEEKIKIIRDYEAIIAKNQEEIEIQEGINHKLELELKNKENEFYEIKLRASDLNKTIEELKKELFEYKLALKQRDIEILQHITKELNQKKAEIEFYKTVYEDRRLLGVIKDRLLKLEKN